MTLEVLVSMKNKVLMVRSAMASAGAATKDVLMILIGQMKTAQSQSTPTQNVIQLGC